MNDRLTMNNDANLDEQLDDLLRQWHDENAQQAASGRDRLLRTLANEAADAPAIETHSRPLMRESISPRRALIHVARSPYLRIAASIALMIALAAMFLVQSSTSAFACDVVWVAEGGKLEAIDRNGRVLGPCPLRHTDVDVDIAGFVSRVTVTQTYSNPYRDKIEAVYTFPLSHRAAVDRMTMRIGDRVIVGEVKERQQARQMYESAKASNQIASLLEQERPNIFTQQVANIEPGKEIIIEVSYVETVEKINGEYQFVFPMVVAPRYIPGREFDPSMMQRALPDGLVPRMGVTLLGPAQLDGLSIIGSDMAAGPLKWAPMMQDHRVSSLKRTLPDETVIPLTDVKGIHAIAEKRLRAMLNRAIPIEQPADAYYKRWQDEHGMLPRRYAVFGAGYGDDSHETGWIFENGVGYLGNRWFFVDLGPEPEKGHGSAPNTNQVPDASRITPIPVRPEVRAGHDISVSVSINTGGAPLSDVRSESHRVSVSQFFLDNRHAIDRFVPGDNRLPMNVTLADNATIPNRDFILKWKQPANQLETATFAHTDAEKGNFFTMIIEPPAKVANAEVPAREIIFVLDSSGSMKGQPIEKAKAVMRAAIDTMRPQDTFNIISFNNTTDVWWNEPQPASDENRAVAHQYVDARTGGGGTEMKNAVLRAMNPPELAGRAKPLTPDDVANLPADGRDVYVRMQVGQIRHVARRSVTREDARRNIEVSTSTGNTIAMDVISLGAQPDANAFILVNGRWATIDGDRLLKVDSFQWEAALEDEVKPLRLVLMLTDGQIGNDWSVVDGVKQHQKNARMFCIGVGSSPNRFLLDGMSKAGRGSSDYITLEGNADDAAKRFAQRIATPVLANIELAFSDNLDVKDMVPAPEKIADLWDQRPIVIHGRYDAPGKGSVALRGWTGSGRYERTIELDLPEKREDNSVIATLWARAQVGAITAADAQGAQNKSLAFDDRQRIIELGEQFGILTDYTSFVAIEKAQVTIAGEPRLVTIPIEMPHGQQWEGIFGDGHQQRLRGLQPGLAGQQPGHEQRDIFAASRDHLAAQQAGLPSTTAEEPDTDGDAERNGLRERLKQAEARIREIEAEQGWYNARRMEAAEAEKRAAVVPDGKEDDHEADEGVYFLNPDDLALDGQFQFRFAYKDQDAERWGFEHSRTKSTPELELQVGWKAQVATDPAFFSSPEAEALGLTNRFYSGEDIKVSTGQMKAPTHVHAAGGGRAHSGYQLGRQYADSNLLGEQLVNSGQLWVTNIAAQFDDPKDRMLSIGFGDVTVAGQQPEQTPHFGLITKKGFDPLAGYSGSKHQLSTIDSSEALGATTYISGTVGAPIRATSKFVPLGYVDQNGIADMVAQGQMAGERLDEFHESFRRTNGALAYGIVEPIPDGTQVLLNQQAADVSPPFGSLSVVTDPNTARSGLPVAAPKASSPTAAPVPSSERLSRKKTGGMVAFRAGSEVIPGGADAFKSAGIQSGVAGQTIKVDTKQPQLGGSPLVGGALQPDMRYGVTSISRFEGTGVGGGGGKSFDSGVIEQPPGEVRANHAAGAPRARSAPGHRAIPPAPVSPPRSDVSGPAPKGLNDIVNYPEDKQQKSIRQDRATSAASTPESSPSPEPALTMSPAAGADGAHKSPPQVLSSLSTGAKPLKNVSEEEKAQHDQRFKELKAANRNAYELERRRKAQINADRDRIAGDERTQRDRQIKEMLRRVDELQSKSDFESALQIVDQALFLDPENHEAQSQHTVIKNLILHGQLSQETALIASTEEMADAPEQSQPAESQWTTLGRSLHKQATATKSIDKAAAIEEKVVEPQESIDETVAKLQATETTFFDGIATANEFFAHGVIVHPAQIDQVLTVEHIIISIVALAFDDKRDEAMRLADELAAARAEISLITELQSTLTSESLTDDDRLLALDRIARLALQSLATVERNMLLNAEVHRRIDESLWPAAFAGSSDGALWPDHVSASDDNAAMLSVLVQRADQSTRDAIAQSGATVVDLAPSVKVIVVSAKPDQLMNLALVPGVRKIEAMKN